MEIGNINIQPDMTLKIFVILRLAKYYQYCIRHYKHCKGRATFSYISAQGNCRNSYLFYSNTYEMIGDLFNLKYFARYLLST